MPLKCDAVCSELTDSGERAGEHWGKLHGTGPTVFDNWCLSKLETHNHSAILHFDVLISK